MRTMTNKYLIIKYFIKIEFRFNNKSIHANSLH